MLDGKKKSTDQDIDYTEDVPDTGSLGGESEQEEEEDKVTDETMVEDLEGETDQAE